MQANLETLVPGLAELRMKERTNRAFGFMGLTHTVCGVELEPMRPRDRLALSLLRNAFVGSRLDPLEGDVFTFLWVLSPRYSRRTTLASLVRQFFLRRRVKRLDLGIARAEIRAYVVAQLQDLPESAADAAGSIDQSPWVHWAATDASWWMNRHGGFTLETYLSTPYLVLQQLYRGFLVNNPHVWYDRDGNPHRDEPSFINDSDRLVGAWQRQFRDAARDEILKQTTRLD